MATAIRRSNQLASVLQKSDEKMKRIAAEQMFVSEFEDIMEKLATKMIDRGRDPEASRGIQNTWRQFCSTNEPDVLLHFLNRRLSVMPPMYRQFYAQCPLQKAIEEKSVSFAEFEKRLDEHGSIGMQETWKREKEHLLRVQMREFAEIPFVDQGVRMSMFLYVLYFETRCRDQERASLYSMYREMCK